MNRMRRLTRPAGWAGAAALSLALALTCSLLAAPSDRARIFLTSEGAALVSQGLADAAPTGAAAEAFPPVPSPGLRFVANVAQATTAPWIDSNAWRFRRGARKAAYPKLPAGAAPLAAAEAFSFDVEAILTPDPADLDELGSMLKFLEANEAAPLPALANIGVVDGKSPAMDEILNLLSRRNLLYRVIQKPEKGFDLMVQLGAPDFPEAQAANPAEFAALVRAKLGDGRRLVRLYGTSTVIAHVTGDDKAARLFLLSYGGPRRQSAGMQQGIRVRVLGRYQPRKAALYGAPAEAALQDVDHVKEPAGEVTEFTLPSFRTLAIIDLDRLK
jgi:hypothetical protein